jgi:polyisoprenoid-binding protein YceI
MKRFLLAATAVAALGASLPSHFVSTAATRETAPIAAAQIDVPAGGYTLDKAHASLIFRVDHLGFSKYTGRFATFDAKLVFDPRNPTASSVTATIDPNSLQVENPPAGFLDSLRGPEWLNTVRFPQLTFHSKRVELTGRRSARIVGELNLHGVTQPVTLDATFNGGYAGHPMDPHARIGFSAKGAFNRSAFGIAFGIPAPGTTMGVGDKVEVVIEAEFNGPALVAKK